MPCPLWVTLPEKVGLPVNVPDNAAPLIVVAASVAAVSVPVNVGDAENTKLVEVVPVVPAAENPVMLLKQVIDATAELVPPFATTSVPPNVTAPAVGEAGVRPVVPAENVETALVRHGVDRSAQDSCASTKLVPLPRST